ncbi:hypothetical protein NKH77_49945 [Streptomyces sp. M19]
MASSADPEHRVAEARPRLVTRPLLLRFVTVIGSSASFFLLLSVAPAYVQSAPGGAVTRRVGDRCADAGHGGRRGDGPWLAARCGHRVLLGAGLFLLGAPALALTVSRSVGTSWRCAWSGGSASRSRWWRVGR